MQKTKRITVAGLSAIISLSIFGAMPAAHASQLVVDSNKVVGAEMFRRSVSQEITTSPTILGLTDKNKNSLSILGIGKDGYARTIDRTDNGFGGGVGLSNSLNLLPTDRISISEDGKQAEIITASGEVLGHFEDPTLSVGGKEVPGEFFYENGSLVTYADSAHSFVFYEKSCWQGTTAKWTWRVAGTLICGATGVVTVIGGGVCGLAWAGAEDAMNINKRACK
ncbi:hypothetical protein EBF03_01120 [Arcanobacterium haemolyticum]|uniref:Uncharacterized protein n=1 Tax=Arcanobacterium haemolyticum (strain ATCC 9345 / DSM 20595 / CCM 5947 / CCUG 17215 / LMG 16163 / NBRC 15585 / NCTC 8452 / 11018) TaxID=644284 RepID=D7BM45_ARCHD|nr:hypothetical protein [Arcanobacterium haemolyticum]ADH91994.1 hypothetical protein Arch_0233 [Arcanobacterium haemolyticum DSM 20595]QCX46173.1 hypothetical protein EBF03_01120 [Arcanobacterium haemolyticum]SQH29304.1 Uncharacterised protein [Arcanobacterium haemolyticum]